MLSTSLLDLESPVKRIVVVLNPVAGRGQGRRRRQELQRLLDGAFGASGPGARCDLVESASADDVAAQAHQAVEGGADLVAAAGGDGTLSAVAGALAGTSVRLGVIPLGTGNDFARCIGIGADLSLAVETLAHGVARPIDLGRCDGRWFLNIAGCGFDAVVADRVNRGFRGLRGTSAYVAAVIQCLVTFRAVDMRITLDGCTQEVRTMLCAIANASSYGGGMRIAPDADLNDGLFDICLIREAGIVEFLLAFPRVFAGTHGTHPKVTLARARDVRIESDPPMPVLLDGELTETTPIHLTLVPSALAVMMPAPRESER